MIMHHLTYAIRHLAKNKLYSILNLFGLSIGLACFALIGLWVKSELSYDRFHEKSDRIYRVVSKFVDETSVIDQAGNKSTAWSGVDQGYSGGRAGRSH